MGRTILTRVDGPKEVEAGTLNDVDSVWRTGGSVGVATASVVEVKMAVIVVEVAVLQNRRSVLVLEKSKETKAHGIASVTTSVGVGGSIRVDDGSTAVEVGSVDGSVIVAVGTSLDTTPVSTGTLEAILTDSIVDAGTSVIAVEVAMLKHN